MVKSKMPIVHEKEKDRKAITKKAKSLGLDQIDFDTVYKLIKVGAKVQSEMGYPDKMVAIPKAKVFVIGCVQKRKTHVWIGASWITGEWFKTSPIVKFTKISDTEYDIETQNSLYKLEKF